MKIFSNFKKSISTVLLSTLLIIFGFGMFVPNISAGKIVHKNSTEISEIIKQTKTDKKTLLVVTNMSAFTDIDEFFKAVMHGFRYPKQCPIGRRNVASFADWHQDLSWISKKQIVWILKGFTESKIPQISKEVLKECLEEAILPYWAGEEGLNPNPKPFEIYYS